MAVTAAPMMMQTAMVDHVAAVDELFELPARRLFMVDPFLRETFCQGIMPLFAVCP